ncbi:hypothetical protein JCM11491_004493 [Sporobolomyces phaffii]
MDSTTTRTRTTPRVIRHEYQSLEELFHAAAEAEEDEPRRRPRPRPTRLSWWDLLTLTLGPAGAQLAWTVELAYGTPYLVEELGLSKPATALVWIAGPLSGLVVQPLVGAYSDRSTSKYRRRQYVALSAAVIVASTLVVAFARELAQVLCRVLTPGSGDWDPDRTEREHGVAIALGVGGFYLLDFSLNGAQAAMRALMLDVVPTEQQSHANAWLGRQSHVSNLVGYLVAMSNLADFPALRWIGGGQFRRLGVLSSLVMLVTVTVTCVSHPEPHPELELEREQTQTTTTASRVFVDIRDSIRTLPDDVRRVCYVQLFAWTAWFPFLFYATTYVAEAVSASIPPGEPLPAPDDRTRAGARALLLYAVVSLAAGTVLPYLTTLADRPWFERRVLSSPATAKGRAVRAAVSVVTPRNCWTFGLAMYAVGTAATWFVSGPTGATAVVAFQGVAWAVTCWVPFALVMEYIREEDELVARRSSSSDNDDEEDDEEAASASTPTPNPIIRTESSPLLLDDARSSSKSSSTRTVRHRGRGRGGTILGIHNLSIVAPQFLVAIVSAVILRSVATRTNDVVWVLRFGGVAAVAGAVTSRWVMPPRTEREYVARVLYGDHRVEPEGERDGPERRS